MTDREALFRSVCENPEDDTPRVVFADWLEEFGNETEQARAEFIRIQCLAARLPFGSSARVHREHRLKYLLPEHAAQWRQELPQARTWRWGEEFDRGFITSFQTWGGHTFAASVDACFQAAPITTLTANCCIDWKQLSRKGYLHRLSVVNIDSGNLASNSFELSELGPWPRLRRVMAYDSMTDTGSQLSEPWPPIVEQLRKSFDSLLLLPYRRPSR